MKSKFIDVEIIPIHSSYLPRKCVTAYMWDSRFIIGYPTVKEIRMHAGKVYDRSLRWNLILAYEK